MFGQCFPCLQSVTAGGSKHLRTPSGLLPLTLNVLRSKRKQHLWCVTDSSGKFMLIVLDTNGKAVNIRCSFVAAEDIDHMVSYRWKEFCTVPENQTQIAVNFRYATEGRGRCWVDSLNHLNDNDLKLQVLESMGGMYFKHKVVAEYFLYTPKTVRQVFRLLLEATRGWMWQEIALGEQGVREFGSNTARLCLQMLRLGSDSFDRARQKNDQCISAMASALTFCNEQAAQAEQMLASRCDKFWEEGGMKWKSNCTLGQYNVLIDVPDASVAAVAEMVASCDPVERTLMSAAANLCNGNIGRSTDWLRPDTVAASCSVLSAMPDFSGGDAAKTTDERTQTLLHAIRRQLLRSALAAVPGQGFDFRPGIKLKNMFDVLANGQVIETKPVVHFHPVPCEDERVTDLFGLELRGVKFVAGARLEPGDHGLYSDYMKGWVQLRRGRDWENEPYKVHIRKATAAELTAEQAAMPLTEEQRVVAVHVSLQPADRGAVQITAHRLLLVTGMSVEFQSIPRAPPSKRCKAF